MKKTFLFSSASDCTYSAAEGRGFFADALTASVFCSRATAYMLRR